MRTVIIELVGFTVVCSGAQLHTVQYIKEEHPCWHASPGVL